MTIKELANICGVSVATVSKALNNHSDVSAETASRIQEMARRLSYFPNSSARALKTSRTYNLGVLYDDNDSNGLTHDYFSPIINGFKVTAEARGYDITFIGGSPFHKMTYYEHSKYRGVDGLLIANADFARPATKELMQREIPLVAVDHASGRRTAIMSDNLKGMRQLVEYICDQGHERIAYIYGRGEPGNATTRNRLQAYRSVLARRALKVQPGYLQRGKYRDTLGAARLTEELLDLPQPPTCIIYPDDFSAIGGINALKERNLHIPDDISIAGYDGILMAKTLEPNLTTYAQNTEMIGRLAAEKLIYQIEFQLPDPAETIYVEGSLIKGDSVKRMRPAD